MKRKIAAMAAALTLFLSACSSTAGTSTGAGNGESGSTENGAETTGEVTVTSNRLSGDYYRAVITDGAYLTSQSRGSAAGTNSTYNLKAFEVGLMGISQSHFDPQEYYFQEGQFLDTETVNSWLGRVSETNTEGLNPEDNGSTEPDERNPYFLDSILEQNYMVQTDNGFQTAGISIGLAMNSVDYYRKEVGGPLFETVIEREELLAQGKEIANKVMQRLRQKEGVGNVPIVVGIFEQTSQGSLAGGVYITQGVSENGSASINDWEQLNESKVVFPTEAEDSTELTSFQNFKAEVESFFPNLSGVTAVATYSNDQMVEMKVDVVTQFYGEGEIIAFTQHVADKANTFLPTNIPIEVTISSINGVESFLARQAQETEFYTHVFD